MSILHITRGLPASGKTTWARRWLMHAPEVRARVNRDDLRAMMFDQPTYEWAQEQLVTEAARALVRILLAAGWEVVADDTNLRPKYVREWQRFATANGADIEVHEFLIDVETAIARDAARLASVGETVIRDMATKYLRHGQLLPIPDETPAEAQGEAYTPVPGTPPAVIVDIDGTLALHGDRSPYDLTRVHEDQPNAAVIEAVTAARAAGNRIIFCSGREDSSYAATLSWLITYAGATTSEPLFMRAAGDRRKDAVVKRELFDHGIRHQYDVRYVLDDRQQVVDMWRDLGLTVFQVARGDF